MFADWLHTQLAIRKRGRIVRFGGKFAILAAFVEWLFDGHAGRFESFGPRVVPFARFPQASGHFAALVEAIADTFGMLVAFGK